MTNIEDEQKEWRRIFEDFLYATKRLVNFEVICDDTTNTPDVIARNELCAKITIFSAKELCPVCVQLVDHDEIIEAPDPWMEELKGDSTIIRQCQRCHRASRMDI